MELGPFVFSVTAVLSGITGEEASHKVLPTWAALLANVAASVVATDGALSHSMQYAPSGKPARTDAIFFR